MGRRANNGGWSLVRSLFEAGLCYRNKVAFLYIVKRTAFSLVKNSLNVLIVSKCVYVCAFLQSAKSKFFSSDPEICLRAQIVCSPQ